MSDRSDADRKGQKSKAKGPAWLGSASAGAAQRSTTQWKATPNQPHDPEARSRAMRAFAVVGVAALFAGFLYYVLTRPEPTPLISLRATTYPLQMPPLAFAEEDAELLTRVSPSNVRVLPAKLDSAPAALDELRKTLKTAGRSFHRFSRGSHVVLIHIAAHGMVNESDQPCLVPPTADPFNSKEWLPLSQVFEEIRNEESLRGKRKLVMLDCQRVTSCWRCGWLESRFFERVGAAVKAASDADLFVLTTADAGQINWAAPELRSTVFGHFLARGLRGEGSGGYSVSLQKLVRFVTSNVDAYSNSRQRRGAHQQPVLWHSSDAYRFNGKEFVNESGEQGQFEDFMLAYVDTWSSQKDFKSFRSEFDPLTDARSILGQTTTKTANAPAAGETLQTAWNRYRQRRESPANDTSPLPAYVVDPVAWSSIQDRLAAIGERLLAGREYQATALQTEIDRLARDLNSDEMWRPRGTLPQLSYLHAARQPNAVKATEQLSPDENLLLLYLKAEPDKREELLPKQANYPRVLSDVCTALADGSSPADVRKSLQTALELLNRYRPADVPPLLEDHFLKLLNGGLVSKESLTSSQLAMALKARQLSQRAASPLDSRVHYAFEPLVNSADDKLREAEDLFLLGTEQRRSEALWKEATSDSPAAGYAAILGQEWDLARSYQLRDEIWADWPLLAEWAGSDKSGPLRDATQTFVNLIRGSIDLDEAIEASLRSRDESGTLTTHLRRCQRIFDPLSQDWKSIRDSLTQVYDQPVNIENVQRRSDNIRNADAVLKLPPLAGNPSQLVQSYLQTLEAWAEEDVKAIVDASSGATADPTSPPPADQLVAQYPLFRELHRLLDYEFVDPYAQHLHTQAWDENRRPDIIFRENGAQSAWEQTRLILDSYDKADNKAIANTPPSWGNSQRAVAATAKLRQWDRRIRVAGPWLASFQTNLKRPINQPSPAIWLQQINAAHWISWQAYRARCDFWGNGESPAARRSRPYFAEAIDRCEAALPETMRPIRYDTPGGGFADFAERSDAALTALDLWEPLAPPRPPRAGATPSGTLKIDLALQRRTADASLPVLPAGVATLALLPSPAAPLGTFDSAGQEFTHAIPLPVSSQEAPPLAAYLPAPGNNPSSTPQYDARLWFRGHVRSRTLPLPAGDQTLFVEYEFARPNYPPPTVEVRGTDAIRGAVMIVFDCSASMQADSRFPPAKREVIDLLKELDQDARGSLRVGLMAYGRQTPADAFSKKYYELKMRYDAPNNLTPHGREQKSNWRGTVPFEVAFPHPDRDVKVYAPLAAPLQAIQQLNEFQIEQCRGCTPLYYSIQTALDQGFSDLPRNTAGVRQIVVISDGVNMPYETYNGAIGTTVGLGVNNQDRASLDSSLARHSEDTQVLVVLFGVTEQTETEKEQLKALQNMAKTHRNFQVSLVPNANGIKKAIYDALPKATIELRRPDSPASTQQMAFNQPLSIRDWPADGLLRREPLRETVHLKLPGESRTIDHELELLGGERVVLQYDPSEGQAFFIPDEQAQTFRKSNKVQPPRPTDTRRLQFDALDPERIGLTVSKFNFRLREEEDALRFAPRPKYIWVEMKPVLLGGETTQQSFPFIDTAWKENVNLPWLQMAVEKWPDCPAAKAKAWFRYTDPLALAQAKISPDRASQVLTAGPMKWQIDQTGGDAGSPRKITATWEPTDGQPELQKLLDQAVWLTPPPDLTRRQYALDGSTAIHEFTYNRADVSSVDIRVVSKANFEQGAYSTELTFDTAN
jgi:hypothetical protein